MNKKVLFVSMLTIGMLVGCGNNNNNSTPSSDVNISSGAESQSSSSSAEDLSTPSTTITYKDAIAKINEHKIEINTFDRIGIESHIETLKVESKTTMGANEEKVSIGLTNSKEEFKVSGLTSAKDANGLAASLSSTVGAITLDDGITKVECSNATAKAYLNNSNLYVDASDKALKKLVEAVSGSQIPDENSVDKFYQPLDMEGLEFPLLSEEMLATIGTIDINELITGVVSGMVGSEADPEEIARITTIVTSSIDVNDFVSVKVSKDYQNFSFNVEVTKENLLKTVKKGIGAFLISSVPTESMTDEEKAAIEAEVNLYVSTIKNAIEQGGFEHIKFNVEMRDYLVTEASYDVNVGFVTSSTTTYDETSSSLTEETYTQALSLEAKGNVKISYGNQVTVDTLEDYSDFVDISKADSGKVDSTPNSGPVVDTSESSTSSI